MHHESCNVNKTLLFYDMFCLWFLQTSKMFNILCKTPNKNFKILKKCEKMTTDEKHVFFMCLLGAHTLYSKNYEI